MSAIVRRSGLLLLALAATSCGLHSSSRVIKSDHGFFMTAEQVRRTGGNNAWEVLRRSGAPISMSETRSGAPGRVRKRGDSSIYLNNTPLLVVDEVRMNDLAYLREIPVTAIHTLQVISGTQGTTRYGTGSGNGVIIVTTRVPETEN